ncbi:MAG: pyridoxamine 5'-phosphate oxidase family protein [Patescibacteria group bacterium]|nr:pyridoxamine 5'-phosphate oxidase family protein [Patescibacteria group bacterium]
MLTSINTGLKHLIENNAMALATVNPDGKPHCIAVALVKVVSENQVLISDNYMQETPKNIKVNNNVCLTVWNPKWQESCVGFEMQGTAEHFTSGKLYEMMKNIPENKGEPNQGAILVTIHHIKDLS